MMSSQVTNKNGGCYRRISSVASVVSSSLTSTGVVPRRSRLPLGSGGRTAAAGWLAGRRPLQVGEAVNKKKYLSFPNFPISFFFSLYSRARSTHRWVMLSLGYAAILYANTVQGVSIYDPLLHPTPPPSRVCCANLEEPPALMKMGLSMVLVGHVNFLLGALVHGVVLRHINLHKQARAMEYAISNVVALASGLVGIVIGILAIVLSKNKKSRALTWSLFSSSLISSLMASASAIGLLVSVVRAIIHGGRSLLTHCRFPDAVDYSSVTNECPFDPTRIYVSPQQAVRKRINPSREIMREAEEARCGASWETLTHVGDGGRERSEELLALALSRCLLQHLEVGVSSLGCLATIPLPPPPSP
ncbi:transmembrane protein 54b isoform 2-T2 [Syngnathus typhle]